MNLITRDTPVGSVVVNVRSGTEADVFADWDTADGQEDTLRLGLQWRTPPLAAAERWLSRLTASMAPAISDAEARIAANGPWAPDVPGWMCAGYGPFRRLTGVSAHSRSDGPTGPFTTLFHEDAVLAESVGWLVDLHHRVLQEHQTSPEGKGVGQAASSLMGAVPMLLRDGLLPHQYQVNAVSPDGLWVGFIEQ
ncbi:hypothetical protein [Streptomyces pseudogriseolus]|uniref:hypothetical protein n=1 Tax=Streptomyces pseudogriseolus TaxID=36817 RepID=UPI001CE265DC|nr:hypothetical protein [Streptomyces pseudogriseolus]